jgi:hypothetical protein
MDTAREHGRGRSRAPEATRWSVAATALVGVVVTCGAAAGVSLASAPGTPSARASSPAKPRATVPGGVMTRQLPQDITVSVGGRRVSVHFGSLRRRAVRTAAIRFTRTSGRTVVRTARASGILRLTAPSGARKVRVTVPRTQEWTATSITRTIRR